MWTGHEIKFSCSLKITAYLPNLVVRHRGQFANETGHKIPYCMHRHFFFLLAIVYLKVKGLIKVSANLSKLRIAAIATTFKAKSTALETCRQLFSSQTEITS